MKIGFFTDGYLPSVTGVSFVVDLLAKELEKRGHQVFIVAPDYPEQKKKSQDDRRVIRLRSVKIPGGNHQQRFATYVPTKAFTLASQLDVDIIHGHAGGPVTFLGWQVAKIKNIPFVYTYHTLWNRYTHYILKGKIITPKMMETMTKLLCNLSDEIIAPSEKVKKELVSYGVKKPVVTIPNGIDIGVFTNSEKEYLRKKLKIKSTDKILLYVGRLGKEKSVEFLIRSFEKIAKKNNTVHFVIAGDGPYGQKLKDLSKSLGVDKKTYFLGFINHQDLPKIYSDADIFLFASQTETQGMVILEAMASGVPVVAVDDPAFHALVNGQNGKLVKKSYNDFVEALVAILDDNKMRQKMIENAKESVKPFSIHKTGDAIVPLYQKLVDYNRKKKSASFPFFGE